jgi:hydrogenase maturation protease
MHNKCLILGMGNTLFGDDGAGVIVAEQLKEMFLDNPYIDVEDTSWGGFRIIDLLSGYKDAIIIDAIQTGKVPTGYIHSFDYKDFIHSVRMVSFHDINFATAIELANQLDYPMPANITVFAIEVESITEFSTELSPQVNAAVNHCKNTIIKLLEEMNYLKKEIKEAPFVPSY